MICVCDSAGGGVVFECVTCVVRAWVEERNVELCDVCVCASAGWRSGVSV